MILSLDDVSDTSIQLGDDESLSLCSPDDSNNFNSVTPPQSDIAVESLPPYTQQQIEEERLRGDILRYLVKNSNGTYHYSAELRAIIHDVVGIPYNASQTEFQETVTSLLDILHSDPQRRFLISGEVDNILVKRCFVRGDEEEISDLVEEWRALIAAFLLESKRSVGLSDIGSSVPRPMRIPSSVKLIFIMKTDPYNRFILKGDGNAAKARYNMQTDPDQESLWMAKWRDDIASFLTKQQWSVPSVALMEINAHIVRPQFLPARVNLLDALEADPFQRFIIIGFGNDAHVMIRNFRGDEPEIEEFVEHWRLLISSYLLSKSAILGVAHPLLGLSEIGANVPRPPGVPTSVKLIDVMRADPRNRFIIKGDGNALRAKINSGGQAGRISYSNMIGMSQSQRQHSEEYSSEGTEYLHNYSQQNMLKVAASRNPNGFNTAGSTSTSERTPLNNTEDVEMSDSFNRLGMPEDLSPSFTKPGRSPMSGGPIASSRAPHSSISRCQSMIVQSPHNDANAQQRIRQAHQLQVQQFHQRQSLNMPVVSPNHLSGNALTMRGQHMRSSIADMQDHLHTPNRSSSGIGMGWNIAGTMSLDRDREINDRLGYLHPTIGGSAQLMRGSMGPENIDFDPSYHNKNSNSYAMPISAYTFDPQHGPSPQTSQRQDVNVIGGGRGFSRPPGLGLPNSSIPHQLKLPINDTMSQGSQQRFSKYDNVVCGDNGLLPDSFFYGRDFDPDVNNISPSVSSVHSNFEAREREMDRILLLPLQSSEYDSSSTRSDGDLGEGDGTVDQNHQGFSNFSQSGSRTTFEKTSRSSTHSTYHSSQPISNTAFSINHSLSGSLFSGGYNGLDPERSPHSLGLGGFDQTRPPLNPSSPGLQIPATNPRSFQSELSDPEHSLAEEEIGSHSSIPLDKWMIKAWLPIVFSGFDYDVIDSFVARLRDDGGFVTVQDLLDAVARDELSRENLADIAGFKVGHCNRLDKALGVYNSKCIPK